MQAIPRYFEAYNWITILLVIFLILLAVVKNRYLEDFQDFISIIFSKKYFTEAEKSNKIFTPLSLWLFFIGALVISLGISFLISGLFGTKEVSLLLFFKVFIIYIVFILSKFFVEKICGNVFYLETFFDDYIFYKLTFKNFLNIIILPILIILTYIWSGSPLFYQIILIVFILSNLLFLAKYYRKNSPLILTNVFYFILYLCIFEIAPYYILYKVIA